MEDTVIQNKPPLPPLFYDLTFAIIPTSLTDASVVELSERIQNNGGTIVPFDASAGRIDKIERIRYILSSTSDFPDYHRALELMIDVVKPSWIGACIKANKIKNPRSYSPDPALFMNEVVVCCGEGLPKGDQEAIMGGVLAMGGQYSSQLSKVTTHLIALSMDDERCELAVKKRLPVRFVLPHWFDDCLKVGRRIAERPYLLPDPELMKVDAGAIPVIRTSAQIRDATNPEPADTPTHTLLPAHLERPRTIKAFNRKKVMLADDLCLNKRLKGVIAELVEGNGGTLATNVDDTDIYVCNYRKGDDYVKASQANKDVGNLSWLYYMITHDTWTNPFRRMMHYPRPPYGIGGFEGYKISISSYTGEARVYLENLIRALGADFTKIFKQDNTHLITAHKNSEKCEAAEEWGVHVVNHLWLEESYAACTEQSLTKQRYTYFPPRTNMGEVLGSTELSRDAVEKMFYPKSGKPNPAKSAPIDGVPASSVVFGRSHTDQVRPSSPLVGKFSRRTMTGDDAATPVTDRRFGGKENETPGTISSRGAKDRALTNLHTAMDDANRFEKELKRKGGVTHGGRRQKDDEVSNKPKMFAKDSTRKRSVDAIDEDEGTTKEETDEPVTKSKKARKEKLVPIKYRMLVSGDNRWKGADNLDRESRDKARLRELGLFITDDFKKVDILCAPKVVRTLKFVASLACGPRLVTTEYLDYALKHNALPPLDKYPLQDRAFEKLHGIDMASALDRAKQNKHRLLKDWTIFCTSGVKPSAGYEQYSGIVKANGGTCYQWLGRSTNVTATKRTIETRPQEVSQNLQEDEGDVLYLISEPVQSEVHLWEGFRALAKKHDMVPRIVKNDWLLHAAISQKLHWKPEWELSEEKIK